MLLFLVVMAAIVFLIVGYPWIVAAGVADDQMEDEHRGAVRSGAHRPLHAVDEDEDDLVPLRGAEPDAGDEAGEPAAAEDDAKRANGSRHS